MTVKFEFIDGTKKDPRTRRLARSHAMKGKNVGKKHNRRSRVAQAAPSPASPTPISDLGGKIPSPESTVQHHDQTCQSSRPRSQDGGHSMAPRRPHLVPVASRPLNGRFPFHFPVDATPQSQYVIKQFFADVTKVMFPVQLCQSLDKVNSHLLSVLFRDQTSYHCSMALMATLNHFMFGKEMSAVAAIHHLTQAVGLVNQALDTPAALSDANLSVVNFVVVQKLLRGERSEAEVHLRGLERMIQLRGGLSSLQQDSMLMLKICKTDLDVALHFGTATFFYRDQMPKVLSRLTASSFAPPTYFAARGSEFKDMDGCLYRVFLDVADLAQFFNQGFRIDPLDLQEAIASIGYRLSRFQPMASPFPRTKLGSVCHVALTALMTTLFLQIGRRRFLRYGLVGQRLRDVVTSGLDNDCHDIMLWLLFLGGISVAREDDEEWLLTQIQHTARAGGVHDWKDLHRRVLRLPWIKSLHDEDAERLWYSSLRLTTTHPA
ncbi:hypothetical protein GE09DRAFT_727896 [Coniochaeta sp. 2T2.1]|nr:hypothetical protein GE09DRAFT_727896 [Coniochaeta sp. 2T2.1]